MIEVLTGPVADTDAELNPEEAAWVAYVARHDRIAKASQLTPAAKDALRREYRYLPAPRRRWWR